MSSHQPTSAQGGLHRTLTLLPKERKRITIVREGEPAILNFEQIKNLAVEWDKQLVPIN